MCIIEVLYICGYRENRDNGIIELIVIKVREGIFSKYKSLYELFVFFLFLL